MFRLLVYLIVNLLDGSGNGSDPNYIRNKYKKRPGLKKPGATTTGAGPKTALRMRPGIKKKK